jgi:hypothetical protein
MILLWLNYIKDNGKTDIIIQTEQDGPIIVGQTDKGIKITPFCKGYIELIKEQKEKTFIMNPMTNQASPELLLGIALGNHEECYLKDAKQKHLMVIYCAEIKESIVLGLLTSQKVGDNIYFFSKTFQEEKIAGNITPKTEDMKKPQMFKALRYPEHIKENEFKIANMVKSICLQEIRIIFLKNSLNYP